METPQLTDGQGERTVTQGGQDQGKTTTGSGRGATSRFAGVYFESYTKRWRAGIQVDGKQIRLGRYWDEEAAAEAYDEAARQYLGVDARLNFPREGEEGVRLNEEAALPEGQAVAATPEEREAAKREEEAALERAGWVKQEEVLGMFEVSLKVWNQWKREGFVSRGIQPRVPGRVWYKRADLERWLVEWGPLGEPYPDPERPGCWRVPLTTWASRRAEARREVLIDEESLPIVRGKRWGWAADASGDGGRVVWSKVGIDDAGAADPRGDGPQAVRGSNES